MVRAARPGRGNCCQIIPSSEGCRPAARAAAAGLQYIHVKLDKLCRANKATLRSSSFRLQFAQKAGAAGALRSRDAKRMGRPDGAVGPGGARWKDRSCCCTPPPPSHCPLGAAPFHISDGSSAEPRTPSGPANPGKPTTLASTRPPGRTACFAEEARPHTARLCRAGRRVCVRADPFSARV